MGSHKYLVCLCLTDFFVAPFSNDISLEAKEGGRVLGKLPVPGRPTNLDYSMTRTYCACSGHFSLVYHFSLLSPSL